MLVILETLEICDRCKFSTRHDFLGKHLRMFDFNDDVCFIESVYTYYILFFLAVPPYFLRCLSEKMKILVQLSFIKKIAFMTNYILSSTSTPLLIFPIMRLDFILQKTVYFVDYPINRVTLGSPRNYCSVRLLKIPDGNSHS